MNYTEKQIFDIAKKILSDLDPTTFKERYIEKVTFVSESKSEHLIGSAMNIWLIAVNTVFDSLDFLIIADATGEPVEYQNFNYRKSKIEKDATGKYYFKRSK